MKAVLLLVTVTITAVFSKAILKFNGDPPSELYESPSFSYGHAYPNITYQSQSWFSYPYGKVYLGLAFGPFYPYSFRFVWHSCRFRVAAFQFHQVCYHTFL
ncbi:hypothetical protein E2C01_031367 [Portunus trituberculatus]|uniref:Uncharacterized protein n=1 Tax=Portunus trituberculatus TaxID=210409 RepID=A0A5B7EUC2_PORTR|nr:hypothetical protein [Portunus trituberculatus]